MHGSQVLGETVKAMTHSPLQSTLKTVALVCLGSIEVEGDQINDVIEASNDWSLCSLPMLCTTHPGIFREKNSEKQATVLCSRT